MKTATACIAALLGAVAASPRGVPTSLQNILDNTHGSSLYTYPTDLTRGIVPVSFLLNVIEKLAQSNLEALYSI